MSWEYTGHWGRVAATVTHVFAGWDPPEPEVSLTVRHYQTRGAEVSPPLGPPKPEVPGCLRRPPALAGPRAARHGCGPPDRPPVGLRQRPPRSPEPAPQRWVSHGADRGQRAAAAGQERGAEGGAMGRCGAPAAARQEQPLRSPRARRSEVFSGAGRAPWAARGSRRGGAAGDTAVPAPAGRRAARDSYLPAPSRVCAGPLSPGGGGDQRRSMAVAVPPARALCPRLRLGPRPPAAMPGAPAGRAQPPPPERGAAAALSPIESGARRAPSRLACPGGLPARRSERSPPAPSPTEAAAAK